MPLHRSARHAGVLAFVLVAATACGSDDPAPTAAPTGGSVPPSPSAPSLTAPPSDTSAPPAADASFEITATGSDVTGDTGRLKVSTGDTVRIRITSTTADQVHLHGYDVQAAVGPGQPAELMFEATIPGVFEIELENSGVGLASLQVS